MFAYAGASLVPIAIPCVCLYALPSNSNILFLSTISNRQDRTDGSGLSGKLSTVERRASEQAFIPSLWGMDVHKDLTSTVTNRVSGATLMFLSLFMNWMVSCK